MNAAINIIPFPEMSKSFIAPTLEEVLLHGAKIGLPDSECEKMWYFYDSKNWRVGKVPMQRWKSALSGWHCRWREQGSSGGRSSGANTVILGQEYQRVLIRMRTILGNYGDHQTWTESDKEEYRKLRARRNELKTILGITI